MRQQLAQRQRQRRRERRRTVLRPQTLRPPNPTRELEDKEVRSKLKEEDKKKEEPEAEGTSHCCVQVWDPLNYLEWPFSLCGYN